MILKTVWNASTPVPATSSYRIYRKVDGGAQALIATVDHAVQSYSDTITAPTGTHNYQYGVSGVNNTGQESAIGWGNNDSYTINEPTPSTPAGVATTQTG